MKTDTPRRLEVGDKVTWTRREIRGYCHHVDTMHGVLHYVDYELGVCIVKLRNNHRRKMRLADLRHEDEETEVNEIFRKTVSGAEITEVRL